MDWRYVSVQDLRAANVPPNTAATMAIRMVDEMRIGQDEDSDNEPVDADEGEDEEGDDES